MILYMQYLRVDSCCGFMLFQAAVRIICVFQVLCDIWCYFRCYFHCIVLQLAGVSYRNNKNVLSYILAVKFVIIDSRFYLIKCFD